MEVDGEVNSEGVMERAAVLAKDPHVQQKVRDTLKAFEVTGGTLNMPDYDGVLREVSMCIAILEANPERKQTYGQVMVMRGPMDGYSMWIRTADVFNMRLESFWDPRKKR